MFARLLVPVDFSASSVVGNPRNLEDATRVRLRDRFTREDRWLLRVVTAVERWTSPRRRF